MRECGPAAADKQSSAGSVGPLPVGTDEGPDRRRTGVVTVPPADSRWHAQCGTMPPRAGQLREQQSDPLRQRGAAWRMGAR